MDGVKLEDTEAGRMRGVAKRRKRGGKVVWWVWRIVAECWKDAGARRDEEERGEKKMDKEKEGRMDMTTTMRSFLLNR